MAVKGFVKVELKKGSSDTPFRY